MKLGKIIPGARLAFVLLASLVTSAISSASDEDEYLKMLSEEISKPEYVSKIKEEISQSEKEEEKQASSKGNKTAIKSFNEFETSLVRRYPSSYTIYNDFKLNQKETVYKTYVATQKMSKAKRKIIDLFLGKDK